MEGRKAQGMHLVPATAVKLQKSRVLSIPGVKTVSAIDQLLVTIINLMADKVFLFPNLIFLRLRRYLHLQVMSGREDKGRRYRDQFDAKRCINLGIFPPLASIFRLQVQIKDGWKDTPPGISFQARLMPGGVSLSLLVYSVLLFLSPSRKEMPGEVEGLWRLNTLESSHGVVTVWVSVHSHCSRGQ